MNRVIYKTDDYSRYIVTDGEKFAYVQRGIRNDWLQIPIVGPPNAEACLANFGMKPCDEELQDAPDPDPLDCRGTE